MKNRCLSNSLPLLPVKPRLPNAAVTAVWRGIASRTDVHLDSSPTAARTQATLHHHLQVGLQVENISDPQAQKVFFLPTGKVP